MRIFFFLLIGLLFTACNRVNLNNAEDSLQGEWQVVRVEQQLGERQEFSIRVDSTFEASGDLGQFQFEEEVVTYIFHVENRSFEATNTRWTLTRTKENQGFTRVERYTLSTPEQTFGCQFGDETSDAERNATEVRLSWETEEIGAYERVVLYLEKE